MGKHTEPVNVCLPAGWKKKSREQGISLSGVLRAQLRQQLDLSEKEIEEYRSYLTGGRK
jgi:hypothetical protein